MSAGVFIFNTKNMYFYTKIVGVGNFCYYFAMLISGNFYKILEDRKLLWKLSDFFNEIIRADAVKEHLEKTDPAFLRKLRKTPEVLEKLFKTMQEVSARMEEFLERPYFPGEENLFYQLFVTYLEEFGSFENFRKRLPVLFSLRFRVSAEHLVDCDSFTRAKMVFVPEAEFYLDWLPELVAEHSQKNFVLDCYNEDFRSLLRYTFKDFENVFFRERKWRSSPPLSECDFAILYVDPPEIEALRLVRVKKLGKFPVREVKRILSLLKNNAGAAFILPVSFFTSFKEQEERVSIAEEYQIEKILFVKKGARFGVYYKEISVLHVNKRPPSPGNIKVVFVQLRGEQEEEEVPQKRLQKVSIWLPEVLQKSPPEELLNFLDIEKEKKRLGEVASFKRGVFIRKKGSERSKNYTHRLLSVGDIETGRIAVEELNKIQYPGEAEKFEVKPGDIVISARGTVVKVAIVPETDEKIIISDSLIAVCPHNYSSQVLYVFLNSKTGQALLEALRGGSVLLNISVSDLEDLPVPSLSPEKQKKLEKEIIKAEEDYRRKLEEAEMEYRQSMERIYSQIFRS